MKESLGVGKKTRCVTRFPCNIVGFLADRTNYWL